MYENVGKKLMFLSKVVLVIEIVITIYYTVPFMTADENLGWALLIFCGGIFGALLSSWMIYAIGETNETVTTQFHSKYHDRNDYETVKHNSDAIDKLKNISTVKSGNHDYTDEEE